MELTVSAYDIVAVVLYNTYMQPLLQANMENTAHKYSVTVLYTGVEKISVQYYILIEMSSSFMQPYVRVSPTILSA